MKLSDVLVYRRAEFGSDHFLVTAKIVWPWINNPKTRKMNRISESGPGKVIENERFNIQEVRIRWHYHQ